MRLTMTALVAAMLSAATPARADEYELQFGVAPGAVLLWEDGRARVGTTARTILQYGLSDTVAIEASIGCAYVQDLLTSQRVGQDPFAGVYYDLQRCDALPAVVGRFGKQWILTTSAGLGYRHERRIHREGVDANGELFALAENESIHALISEFGIGLEARVLEQFGVAGIVRAVLPVAPRYGDRVELMGALFLSFFCFA